MAKDTERLDRAVEAQRTIRYEGVFPESFLDGLRMALDAGLSCEQITAFLVLATGLYESLDVFEGPTLVERSVRLMDVMKGDRFTT